MNNVQIGFSTSNMLLSKVIRWFTKAEYSHCWFLFDMYGKKWILQADIGGVQIDPYEKYEKKWSKIKLITLSTNIEIAPAWDYLSTHYGYLSLIGDIWVYLGRWFKKKWKNPLASTTTQVCSELVTFTLQKQVNLIPGISKLDPVTVSPEDLIKLLSPYTV